MIFPIDTDRPKVIYSRLRTHLSDVSGRVGVHITSHDFRLTRMTELHNDGLSVRELQAFLQEKSLASLEKYLRVHIDDLKDRILVRGRDRNLRSGAEKNLKPSVKKILTLIADLLTDK